MKAQHCPGNFCDKAHEKFLASSMTVQPAAQRELTLVVVNGCRWQGVHEMMVWREHRTHTIICRLSAFVKQNGPMKTPCAFASLWRQLSSTMRAMSTPKGVKWVRPWHWQLSSYSRDFTETSNRPLDGWRCAPTANSSTNIVDSAMWALSLARWAPVRNTTPCRWPRFQSGSTSQLTTAYMKYIRKDKTTPTNSWKQCGKGVERYQSAQSNTDDH